MFFSPTNLTSTSWSIFRASHGINSNRISLLYPVKTLVTGMMKEHPAGIELLKIWKQFLSNHFANFTGYFDFKSPHPQHPNFFYFFLWWKRRFVSLIYKLVHGRLQISGLIIIIFIHPTPSTSSSQPKQLPSLSLSLSSKRNSGSGCAKCKIYANLCKSKFK